MEKMLTNWMALSMYDYLKVSVPMCISLDACEKIKNTYKRYFSGLKDRKGKKKGNSFDFASLARLNQVSYRRFCFG